MAELERPLGPEDVLHLYEIAEELVAVLQAIEAADGELTPEAEDALTAWQETFDKKTERVVHVIRNFEATGKAARDEAKRLGALATSRERIAKSLREYLRGQMQRASIDRVETPLVCVTMHTAHRPSIKVRDSVLVEDLPAAFTRVETKVDGDLCYQSWKAGVLPLEFFDVNFAEFIKIR
jgi:hypothetical protein